MASDCRSDAKRFSTESSYIPALINFTATRRRTGAVVAGNVQNTVCGAVSCTTTLVSFLRAVNGTVKQVNDPLAVPGTHASQGTGVLGINPAGEMFGIYSDTNGIQHGFVTKP